MTEVELCERVREWAERIGFVVYPEVDGWDLVLVPEKAVRLDMTHDVDPGHQVGVHAKLRANCDVLAQAMPRRRHRRPHIPLVAVPRPGPGFREVARALGIGVIDTEPARRYRWQKTNPGRHQHDPVVCGWPVKVGTDSPLVLPPIASLAIQAGSPSPRVLSDWRVKAIRFVAWARAEGSFTIADLERQGIGRHWAERWGDFLETRAVVRRGRPVRINVYSLTDRPVLPDRGYEDVAAELLAAGPG